jgi:aspartate/methionine/tyrosine aminotransferase
VREQIAARVSGNYRRLQDLVGGQTGCEVLQADGGWYAVIRVPAVATEEELVLSLLQNADVLTHPGYFFDFRREAYLVLSLLPAAATFAEGIARILRHFACSATAGSMPS